MAEPTDYLGLIKAAGGEFYNRPEVDNKNLDTIDAGVKKGTEDLENHNKAPDAHAERFAAVDAELSKKVDKREERREFAAVIASGYAGTLAVKQDELGNVVLVLSVHISSGHKSGTIFAVFAEGEKPSKNQYFSCFLLKGGGSASVSAVASMVINTSGEASIINALDAQGFTRADVLMPLYNW